MRATITEKQAILTKSLIPPSPTVVVFNNSVPLYNLIDTWFYFILLDMQLFSSLLILCEMLFKLKKYIVTKLQLSNMTHPKYFLDHNFLFKNVTINQYPSKFKYSVGR